ncbi:HK97-gp10 family putative phage morphogenesis protein [Nocardioides sp. SYSU D00065]|uniref:HK97-gp10 family putative phage morphogenesis protein n=1 Tax=Nocardioides sp. SYSU D00065 TaxID=2817378 RepID=UPI001B3435DD|nr:HK97-gp10 family putative phage morphogenesis protein [Nocardioides sp. SYSU D00065]
MASSDASEFHGLAVKLQRASAQVGAAAAAAVRKTAFDIEADAKALAPVDTGNLRNSISTDITGDGRFGAITADIGPTAEYGAFVEYGTSRMGPQPYMAPAFERREPTLTAALEQIGEQLL